MRHEGNLNLFEETSPPVPTERKKAPRRLAVHRGDGETGFTGLLFDLQKVAPPTMRNRFATPGARCSDWYIKGADPREGWTCPLVSCPDHMFELVRGDKKRTVDELVAILEEMPFHCSKHASRYAEMVGGLTDEQSGIALRIGRSAFQEEADEIQARPHIAWALRKAKDAAEDPEVGDYDREQVRKGRRRSVHL